MILIFLVWIICTTLENFDVIFVLKQTSKWLLKMTHLLFDLKQIICLKVNMMNAYVFSKYVVAKFEFI